MQCPTFTFKNKETGETVTINQSDYNNERYQYLTSLGSLNNWERVSENNAGGDEGFRLSRFNSNVQIGLLDIRKIDKLGQKIIF